MKTFLRNKAEINEASVYNINLYDFYRACPVTSRSFEERENTSETS